MEPEEFPELVRHSKLEITFENNLIIHPQLSGRRKLPQREAWTRQRRVGRGGNGQVWLERKIVNGQHSAELRAVKDIHVPSTRGRYIRELEALAKFSSQKKATMIISVPRRMF